MAVYVDNLRIPWRGKEWCHLLADSLDELHSFAETLGLKRAWFQSKASYPHYDITTQTREVALRMGARRGTRQQIIYCARKLKEEQKGSAPNSIQLALFDK